MRRDVQNFVERKLIPGGRRLSLKMLIQIWCYQELSKCWLSVQSFVQTTWSRVAGNRSRPAKNPTGQNSSVTEKIRELRYLRLTDLTLAY
mmetsp:Transcript_13209/g.22752  ORF Transcript_13209/g.22752 Transcript_13209/m.22752 type:complete len:90 (+) Transcript_13209:44-313(+)